MYKKIILMLFWLWFISLNMLQAKDIEKQNLKVGSDIGSKAVVSNRWSVTDNGSPITDHSLSAQQDTAVTNSPDEALMVNLPFGMSSRKVTVGNITVINPEELLNYDNVTTVAEVISGRVPGIISGLNIHGLGDALVVIDGIPRPIASVTIEEVEQITIIKDADTAILYGVQGRNGIILITTKRGKNNASKITVNAQQGFSLPVSMPKYLGSADYMKYYNEARANDGLAASFPQSQIDGTVLGTKPQVYPDVNYYGSDFLKSYKPNSRAVVEFSGGNKSAQYYLNAGWQHTGSLLNMGEAKSDQDNRLNIRSNINFKINSFISSYVNFLVQYNISKRANGNYWADASTLLPYLYPPLIDTALVGNKQYTTTAQLINGRYMLGGKTGYTNNVWGNLNLSGYSNLYNSSIQFNNGIDFDLKGITKGLVFKVIYSIDFYNQFSETQTNTYAVYEPQYGGTNKEDILSVKRLTLDQFTGVQGVGNSTLARDFRSYMVLDYNRVFNEKHAIGASLLGYGELNVISGVPQKDKRSHLGGRLNYAYADKYIIDLNANLTSSAKLPPSNRLGWAPSIGLGWVVSEENFLKNSSVVNYLKLKASAGRINTDLTVPDYYLYQGQYVGGQYYYPNEIRYVISTRYNVVQNDKLFYEVRNNVNLGVEAALFKKSLSLDVNLFQEHITGMVGQLINPVPDFLGGYIQYTNYAENTYKGIELGAAWHTPVNKDFGFDIGVNATYLKSEITKKDENYAYSYQNRTGKTVNAIFGLESLGMFKDLADIAASTPQSFGTVKPGDIKYKDQNGDNVINAQDEVLLGNYTPDFTGGLNLTLRYKGFSFFALATGSEGSKAIIGGTSSSSAYYWVNSALKYSEVILNRWTPATAETATYPRLTSLANSNNFRTSDFWLYDNSRITINRLQLTYNTPKSFAKKLAMKGLNLYVRGSNIATFATNSANRKIMELNVGNSEPQYRYYAIGLKADF